MLQAQVRGEQGFAADREAIAQFSAHAPALDRGSAGAAFGFILFERTRDGKIAAVRGGRDAGLQASAAGLLRVANETTEDGLLVEPLDAYQAAAVVEGQLGEGADAQLFGQADRCGNGAAGFALTGQGVATQVEVEADTAGAEFTAIGGQGIVHQRGAVAQGSQHFVTAVTQGQQRLGDIRSKQFDHQVPHTLLFGICRQGPKHAAQGTGQFTVDIKDPGEDIFIGALCQL